MDDKMEIIKNHINIIKEYLNGVYVGKHSNAQVRNRCLEMIMAMEYDLIKEEI